MPRRRNQPSKMRKSRKPQQAKPEETTEQTQSRLQRAYDHDWRPKGPLPPGVTLRIP